MAREALAARPGGVILEEEHRMAFTCNVPARPTVQQDDEAVRITRWDFEPGAVTGWHRHAWPYFVVMLLDGTLRVHDGTKVTDVVLIDPAWMILN